MPQPNVPPVSSVTMAAICSRALHRAGRPPAEQDRAAAPARCRPTRGTPALGRLDARRGVLRPAAAATPAASPVNGLAFSRSRRCSRRPSGRRSAAAAPGARPLPFLLPNCGPCNVRHANDHSQREHSLSGTQAPTDERPGLRPGRPPCPTQRVLRPHGVDAIEHDWSPSRAGLCADLAQNPRAPHHSRRWARRSATTSSCGSARRLGPRGRRCRRRPERVDDRLLGRVDRRLEQRIELAAASACRRRGGRDGEEDLAAPVVSDRPRAREAEAGAPRDARELCGASGASVATTAMQLPAGGGGAAGGRCAEQAPDGHAVDAQLARRRRNSRARARPRSRPPASGSTCRSRPCTRCTSSRCPAPTAPSTTAARGVGERAARVGASTWTTRASLSQLSSHSPTTGITTRRRRRRVGCHAAATAPSKTRPTAIVEVR